MIKWPYIANAVFRNVTIRGEQRYIHRIQGGDRSNRPTPGYPLPSQELQN